MYINDISFHYLDPAMPSRPRKEKNSHLLLRYAKDETASYYVVGIRKVMGWWPRIFAAGI